MPNTKVETSTYLIHLLFFLYFVILACERIQSLARSFADTSVKPFSGGFNIYVYGITILSLVASVTYMIVTNRAFFASIFTSNGQTHNAVDIGALCIAAGIMLLAGMVHTEHTVAPVQFVAYGALIVAMIIQTVNAQKTSQNSLMLWLSLVYIIAFSMAIPVMYHSDISNAVLFHILEAVTSAILVVTFTWMLHRVFTGDATNMFFLLPILVAAVLDGILIALRWQEQINTFVLIFAAASCVLWCVGKIISAVK